MTLLMTRILTLLISFAIVGSALIQSPFHRYCAALNELGSCHHFRGPLVTPDVLLAAHRPLDTLQALLHPFPAPYGHHLHVDPKSNQLDNRHFLDMFLHEDTHDGAVSPLDIPLDRSYTHHPNRWEWN